MKKVKHPDIAQKDLNNQINKTKNEKNWAKKLPKSSVQLTLQNRNTSRHNDAFNARNTKNEVPEALTVF